MVVHSEVKTNAARSAYILGAQDQFPPVRPQEASESLRVREGRRMLHVATHVARASNEADFVQRVQQGLRTFTAALQLILSDGLGEVSALDLRSVRLDQLAKVEANWGADLRHALQHDLDVRFAANRVAKQLNEHPCPAIHRQAERADVEQFAASTLLAEFMTFVIDVSVDMDDASLMAVQLAAEWHREVATAMYVSAHTAYERRYGEADDDDDDAVVA